MSEPVRKRSISAFSGRSYTRKSARSIFRSSILSPKEKIRNIQYTFKRRKMILNKSEKASGCVVTQWVSGRLETLLPRWPLLIDVRLGHTVRLCFLRRQLLMSGRKMGCNSFEKLLSAPRRSCSSVCDVYSCQWTADLINGAGFQK